jgi:hypothetical protein
MKGMRGWLYWGFINGMVSIAGTYSVILFLFLLDVSVSRLSSCLPACLPAFSGDKWHESNHHSSLNQLLNHNYSPQTGTSCSLAAYIFCEETLLDLDFSLVWEAAPIQAGYLSFGGGYGDDEGGNHNNPNAGAEPLLMGISARTLCLLFCSLVSVSVWLPTSALPGPPHGSGSGKGKGKGVSGKTGTASGGAGKAADASYAAPLLHQQLLAHLRSIQASSSSSSTAKQTIVTSGDGAGADADGAIPFTINNLIFCSVFFIVNVAVSAIELLLREQDWAQYGLSAEQAYPAGVFVATAGLMMAVSVHLYNLRVLPRDAMFCVLEIQACKLLHLAGLPASSIFSAVLLLVTMTVPFSNLGEADNVLTSSASDRMTAAAAAAAATSDGTGTTQYQQVSILFCCASFILLIVMSRSPSLSYPSIAPCLYSLTNDV